MNVKRLLNYFCSIPAVLALLTHPGSALGQTGPTNTLFPVVTIRATDPLATWSGDPGTFTLFRQGPTNAALNVYCRVGGTASNGVDYATISSFNLIPAGARTSTITVSPINNGQTDVRTVDLTLAPSPMLPPVNYQIGSPSNATVYIRPAGTNIPPWVRLVEPANGSTFLVGANIRLLAYAGDPDGSVTSVEFFADNTSLGIVSNGVVVDPLPSGGPPPGTLAYFLVWSNAPAGNHILTAKATDDGGASTVSAPVAINVTSNLPPITRIISPPNGAIFVAPVNVPLFAYARDAEDGVASVEFLDGSTSIGFGVQLAVGATSLTSPSNIWFLNWSNAPVGMHVLRSRATDTGGAVGVSDPVNITVLPPRPPPTNRPPIVNIVATDPVAVEGTNCWVWPGCTNMTPAWSNWPVTITACRFFTNCGPKDAMFTVHRIGDTNDDVVVHYGIGGSASNGVEYVALSGLVTVPAGEREAFIPIVPIDDGPPDITSTVVLKLLPDTNYVIGFPPKAAAIILDGLWPRATAALPGGCFRVNAAGPDGAWFHVEYSTDLGNWTPLCTNQVVQGSIEFIDPDASVDQARYYRAVPELGLPQF
jgi:hypothetical protein